jgi:UDP-N-acetylglucosamine--N-acetylmuramyl-(pentapeptide) pyrophosphoryl-undecaprenol N-acetylglucosamine transferase
MRGEAKSSWVAVACGGTGGHLFPGIAVGEILAKRGCEVTLVVSPKDVDRRGTGLAQGLECLTLPAIGLERGGMLAFVRGVWRSYRVVRRKFRERRPAVVLAMGGFTSVAPILAGRRAGAVTFLHESNSVPGRANRWLARWVDGLFVGFPQAVARLRHCRIEVTGTPVRSRFRRVEPTRCREALGLATEPPVLLVIGGSQGARGVNDLVLEALPQLRRQVPGLQIVHLTGSRDFERVRTGYGGWPGGVRVEEFLGEMELAMGAATVVISRAGGSVLAELAAMGLPPVLVPYPSAADDHQLYNARALADMGAARLLEQGSATPAAVAVLVRELVSDEAGRERMRESLRRWHRPEAAEEIAGRIMARLESAGRVELTCERKERAEAGRPEAGMREVKGEVVLLAAGGRQEEGGRRHE